jgi:hypothetical protein
MFSKFDTNPQSDELTAADLYDAQGEWEAEQYEAELSDFDPHRDFYAEMDDEPVMELPNDLYMIFDDPYDDDPADMYVWDSDLHNEF